MPGEANTNRHRYIHTGWKIQLIQHMHGYTCTYMCTAAVTAAAAAVNWWHGGCCQNPKPYMCSKPIQFQSRSRSLRTRLFESSHRASLLLSNNIFDYFITKYIHTYIKYIYIKRALASSLLYYHIQVCISYLIIKVKIHFRSFTNKEKAKNFLFSRVTEANIFVLV